MEIEFGEVSFGDCLCRYFRRRITAWSFCLTALSQGISFIAIFYLPLYFHFVHGDGQFTETCCVVRLGIFEKRGMYRAIYVFGGALALVANALMAKATNEDSLPSHIYSLSIFHGAGSGIAVQLPNVVAQASVPVDEMSIVAGFTTVGQGAGGALFIYIAGAIFENKALNSVLRDARSTLSKADVKNLVTEATAKEVLSQLTAPERTVVLPQIILSLSDVYFLGIACAALIVIGGVALRKDNIEYIKARQARPESGSSAEDKPGLPLEAVTVGPVAEETEELYCQKRR